MNTAKNMNVVNRDIDPWIALDRAITHCDEPALWSAVDAITDRDAALQEITAKLPRVAYQHRRTVYLSELLLCPFIVTGLRPGGFTDDDWRSSSFIITDAVTQWFARSTAGVAVMKGFRPYEWVASWQPHVLRAHLLAAVPGRPRSQVEFASPLVGLPYGAPRLVFIALIATCKDTWVKLPSVGAETDLSCRDRISAAVHHHSPLRSPIAMPPMRLSEAISEGLNCWLQALHAATPVLGWRADLDQSGQDLVRITLKLDDEDVSATRFDVRIHQIGPWGLSQVLEKLMSLAPRLDVPLDQTN